MLDVVPSHLDRPAATLGGHVVAGPQPGMIRVVPRTSNLLEQFLPSTGSGDGSWLVWRPLSHNLCVTG